MDFVLALHSHLPYVLNHGRWPHGSDWLCEAALDSYLPLLEQLQELAAPPHGTRAPVTIGFTPVLANQLASPAFAQELEAFFDQREAVCREAPAALAATGDGALLPLVDYWKARLSRLRKLFQAVDRDIVAAFRRLQDDGHLEIIGSAATRGDRPLRARDGSVALPGLSGDAASGEAQRGHLGAGSPLLDASLEPPPGLPRRRVVPRVPQDTLARRSQAVAGDGTRRRSGREARVRSSGRARPGGRPCAPLRAPARRNRGGA